MNWRDVEREAIYRRKRSEGEGSSPFQEFETAAQYLSCHFLTSIKTPARTMTSLRTFLSYAVWESE